MKKRKAKRCKTVEDINFTSTDEQIEISSFSDTEIALLELISKIILRISIEESYEKSNKINDEQEGVSGTRTDNHP